VDSPPSATIRDEDVAQLLALGCPPDSTIAQWLAASDSLQRLNDALLRIGDAVEEFLSSPIAMT
jgi:hypothetical protein